MNKSFKSFSLASALAFAFASSAFAAAPVLVKVTPAIAAQITLCGFDALDEAAQIDEKSILKLTKFNALPGEIVCFDDNTMMLKPSAKRMVMVELADNVITITTGKITVPEQMSDNE